MADATYKARFPNSKYTIKASDGYVFTSPVGSFQAGASPYGVMDMSGNASEWCQDWYDKQYQERIMKSLQKRAKDLGFQLVPLIQAI